MARRYLIPFLSLLLIVMLAFALQTHEPSWKNFIAWMGIVGVLIGILELITGIVLIFTASKELAKEFILTSILILLLGGGICSYLFVKGGFN